MSVNMQLVHVFIILASYIVCGGDASLGSKVPANVRDPEVERAANYATFKIQELSGFYVSLKSVDDAQKEILPAGNKYYLKITVNSLAGGKSRDEKCKVHTSVQESMSPPDTFGYYKCNGILGGFSRYYSDPEPGDF